MNEQPIDTKHDMLIRYVNREMSFRDVDDLAGTLEVLSCWVLNHYEADEAIQIINHVNKMVEFYVFYIVIQNQCE